MRAAARQRFRWGESDCALFVADWVHAVTGTDPAAHLRGYKTQAEAERLCGRMGVLGIVARSARRAGLSRIGPSRLPCGEPAAMAVQPGDIAVVRERASGVVLAAIVAPGGGYAMRVANGLLISHRSQVDVIAAWSVNWPDTKPGGRLPGGQSPGAPKIDWPDAGDGGRLREAESPSPREKQCPLP